MSYRIPDAATYWHNYNVWFRIYRESGIKWKFSDIQLNKYKNFLEACMNK